MLVNKFDAQNVQNGIEASKHTSGSFISELYITTATTSVTDASDHNEVMYYLYLQIRLLQPNTLSNIII